MSEERRWEIKTIPAAKARVFEWRPGLFLRRRFSSTLDADHMPYLVELDLAADDNGGITCLEMRVSAREGGEPLTARVVRDSVQLGELIQMATGAAATPGRYEKGQLIIDLVGGPMSTYEVAAPALRNRKRRLSDDHLREVARVHKAGGMQAVLERWPGAYSTRAKWVAKAREFADDEETTDAK